MSLIHISTLVAKKNALTEDEWSNFEFYADTSVYNLSPYTMH